MNGNEICVLHLGYSDSEQTRRRFNPSKDKNFSPVIGGGDIINATCDTLSKNIDLSRDQKNKTLSGPLLALLIYPR